MNDVGTLPSLSIVIPAFNDDSAVEEVLKDAFIVAQKFSSKFEIIVLDDGSQDATLDILKKIEELYLSAKFDYIFSIPADRQIKAFVLANLITLIDKSDIVIGRRLNRMDNLMRKLQSYFYNFLLRLFFHLNLHDINSSKLFSRKILKNVTLFSESSFVDAELCLKAKAAGYKVLEVNIEHFKRSSETAGGGRLKTVLPVVKDLIYFLLKYEHGQ